MTVTYAQETTGVYPEECRGPTWVTVEGPASQPRRHFHCGPRTLGSLHGVRVAGLEAKREESENPSLENGG